MPDVIHMKGQIALGTTLAVPVAAAGVWFLAAAGGGKTEPPAVLLPPEPGIGQGVAAASPTAAPLVDKCDGPAVDANFLAANQVLSYYGNPHVPGMGILGELEPEELAARLSAHAEKYDALNGARGVQPAFHIVYASAQPEAGGDGLHLQFLDRRTLRQYIDLACEHGFLVFLDIQVGRSDVATEIRDILPYLEASHVHAALDPEFAMSPGQIPGEDIGSLDAADVNAAQAVLQEFVQRRGLPDKMLVVHQFTDGMITRHELIEDYPDVRLVIDSDGVGPADIKQVKFGWYAAPAEHSGIKLYFRQDTDLMTEADVLGLDPDVIIYQ
jgi:hypothetical protein